ncbi:hypothetical protein GJU40_19725 [Bacillus lacus]|uniref:DUF3953 domain-containing protein n=1 Tax=Metabacillus lacus TaxID=1983721 RepID=A0A7X2J359_9BACI|nr:hypothetical protein [Metabacillus lacus]
MKKFSVLSIALIFIGLILIGLNWIIDGYFEMIVLISFISLLVGVVLSFIAIAKKEKGTLKFISLISFFLMMFVVTWFEPFQLLRIITWLKNVS